MSDLDAIKVTGKSAPYFAFTDERKSVYALTPKSPISDEQIIAVVQHATRNTPSPFNSQPLRTVVLLGKHHTKFWDFVLDALREKLDAERFKGSEAMITGAAKNGYFTVMYFTDEDVVKKSQADFANYAPKFPGWAENAQGILQATIWTAFAAEGLSGTLQHYHPLMDEAVRKEWNIPSTWTFSAQAPFGVVSDAFTYSAKPKLPLEETVKVFQ